MKCPNCGLDISGNETECPKCGISLVKEPITNPPLIELVPETQPQVVEQVPEVKEESSTMKLIKGIIAIILVIIFFYMLYNLLYVRGYF